MNDQDNFEDIDFSTEEDFTADTSNQVAVQMKSKTPAKVENSIGKPKNVFFKTTIGPERTEKLSIGEKTPVHDIKETLGNIFQLAPEDFHLSHAGRTLNEEGVPDDYGIGNGDEVLLIPHSQAGADDFEDLDFEDEILENSYGNQATVQVKSKTPAQTKNPASSNNYAGKSKSVFFRSTIGPEKNEKLAIGEKLPIKEIKETLSNVFSLEPEDFHLSHAGRTLNEDATPSDYSIENGDEILLIPHSTAGIY